MENDAQAYLAPLIKAFKEAANEKQAARMRAYLRNHFAFLGIKKPERAALQKTFVQQNGKPAYEDIPQIAEALWELPEREFQYVALDFLTPYMKKPEGHALALYRRLIETKSWWDTVDLLASKGVGQYFLNYPEYYREKMVRWINDDNLWVRRSALLFQLKFKARTDTGLLTKLIEKTAHEKEFFIQKAIGWILREFSKTAPVWVQNFVATHELAPLSKREALKWLKKSQSGLKNDTLAPS